MHHRTYSEAGHNHSNEDAVAFEIHPQNARFGIGILADGQGGQVGGGAASRRAVATALQVALSYSPQQLQKEVTWYEILAAVDETVCDDPEAGFATFIGIAVTDEKVCGVSCGDSLGLLVNAQQCEVLTERQRKNPPLGTGAAFPMAFSTARNDVSKVLLMSDGVWRYIVSEAIANIVRQNGASQIIAQLREIQLEIGGNALSDDFSLLIVE
jgi:serine/threonine protein phosphatase PrpC